MGYSSGQGRFQNTDDTILFSDGTVMGATVTGPNIECGARADGCFELVTTAASGTTPTLDVKIQTSKDGTGSGLGVWRDVGSFTQQTGAASERKSFSGFDRFIRYVATVGGTAPSFTAGCKGELK